MHLHSHIYYSHHKASIKQPEKNRCINFTLNPHCTSYSFNFNNFVFKMEIIISTPTACFKYQVREYTHESALTPVISHPNLFNTVTVV